MELECEIAGAISRRQVVYRADGTGIVRMFGENGSFTFHRKLPKFLTQGSGIRCPGDSLVAPMPGVVEKLNVKEGDMADEGDPLIVMIAMKMEYVIRSPKRGKVDKIFHNIGDFVSKGTLLVKMEESELCQVFSANSS